MGPKQVIAVKGISSKATSLGRETRLQLRNAMKQLRNTCRSIPAKLLTVHGLKNVMVETD